MFCVLHGTIAWLDQAAPWKSKSCFDDSHLADSVPHETHCSFVDANSDFDEWIKSHLTSVDVENSAHEKVDTDHAALQQTHLTPLQQADAARALKKFTNVFSGKLGCCPCCQVHLESNDDAEPFHARPCSVPDP
jgi:hypothetical protein